MAVAICVVACVLFAAAGTAGAQAGPQGAAQAWSGPCYPPPCPAASTMPGLQAASSGAPLVAGPAPRPDGESPAPFVAVGLAMIASTFTVIALSRRAAIVRPARPAVAGAERVVREPDRSLR